MDVLIAIVLATAAGGVLSVAAAALLAFPVLERWVPRLTSFSVGILLGAALLNLLPQAIEAGLYVEEAMGVVLAGIVAFFCLEKLALWRHEHGTRPGETKIKPVGALILIGDGMHNFVDGVLIAAAFLESPALGVAAAVAVIAHEMPQEVGDFLVLRAAGYSKGRALAFNALSGAAAVLGGLLGYALLSGVEAVVPYALALAGASFIYIAVADLVPELHHAPMPRAGAWQVGLMAAGIGVIHVLHGLHH